MQGILSVSAMSYYPASSVMNIQTSVLPGGMCCRNVPRQVRYPFTLICSAAAAVPLPSYVRGGVRQAELPEQQTLINTKTASQDSRRKKSPAPAIRRSLTRAAQTPLHFPTNMASVLSSAPDLLGGSHTQPASGGIAAHGCYRVIGPAHISKRGDCLVARLLPGARLELLSGGGAGATAAPAASLEAPWDDVQCDCTLEDGEDEEGMDGGGVTECVLVAAYVELGGSATSIDSFNMTLQPAVHHHNGHTYLNVRHLPADVVIHLPSDGALSHPVNVTPSPPQ